MATSARRLLICFDNEGYEVSLERRKIYEALPGAAAAKRGLVRVRDASGEDYLYAEAMFVAATLAAAVRRAVIQAA